MSSTAIALQGAPDTLIGTPDAKTKPVQVMQLDLTKNILNELLDCVRDGKSPQVLFGRAPVRAWMSSELLPPVFGRNVLEHHG